MPFRALSIQVSSKPVFRNLILYCTSSQHMRSGKLRRRCDVSVFCARFFIQESVSRYHTAMYLIATVCLPKSLTSLTDYIANDAFGGKF